MKSHLLNKYTQKNNFPMCNIEMWYFENFVMENYLDKNFTG